MEDLVAFPDVQRRRSSTTQQRVTTLERSSAADEVFQADSWLSSPSFAANPAAHA